MPRCYKWFAVAIFVLTAQAIETPNADAGRFGWRLFRRGNVGNARTWGNSTYRVQSVVRQSAGNTRNYHSRQTFSRPTYSAPRQTSPRRDWPGAIGAPSYRYLIFEDVNGVWR